VETEKIPVVEEKLEVTSLPEVVVETVAMAVMDAQAVKGALEIQVYLMVQEDALLEVVVMVEAAEALEQTTDGSQEMMMATSLVADKLSIRSPLFL
jgi:hypothetical protein